MVPQKLILIVDLEATCWDGNVEGLERKQTVDDIARLLRFTEL